MHTNLFAAVALALSCIVAAPANAQCPDGSTGEWTVQAGQRFAGPVGLTRAIINGDPDGAGPLPVMLIAGGSFTNAGAGVANRIAAWNGTDWITFGSGFNSTVYALAIFNGELYAGGEFSFAGATACARIAKWNAAAGAWEPLGAGLTGTVSNGFGTRVYAMTVFNGRLYVGGQFTTAGGFPANCLASWDGSVWRSVGATVPGGGVAHPTNTPYADASVNALAVFNNLLYVGGRFDRVDGTSAMSTLATWSGTVWAPGATVANSVSGAWPEINALASAASGTTANAWLYAGGDFTSFNGVATNYIASISKTTTTVSPWGQVGATPVGGPLGGPVTKLLIDMGLNSPSAILANGESRSSFTMNPTEGLYRFAGGVWNQHAPEQVTALAINGGQYVAGVIANDSFEYFLGRRVGATWQTFGNGLSYFPRGVITGPGGTDLYAYGHITVADQQQVGGIARLDSAGAWNPVGASPFARVSSVAFTPTEIFAVGETSLGAFALRRFNSGVWNGTFGGDRNGQSLLRAFGTDVYFLGQSVYKWDGVMFNVVGSSFSGGDTYELLMYNGALHAIRTNGVYRLDQTTTPATWMLVTGFRGGGDATVYSATVFNNHLFVSFSATLGGVDEFDGVAWTNRAQFNVSSFAELDGQLYALNFALLYKLQGSAFVSVAAQSNGQNLAIHHGNLIIGGTSVVGSTNSPVFARLVCCPADFDGSGGLAVADIFAFLNAWFAGNPTADFDGVNGLQVADIFAFLNAWFAGC